MAQGNPQNKDYIISKRFANAQDIFGTITFILAVVQGITLIIPVKIFLVVSGAILVSEYISSLFKSYYFDKGHRIREMGLIDNSFNEKRIPRYNSEPYYNNASILKSEIKLLANIHENSLFTFRIAEKMLSIYYIISTCTIVLFIFQLFMRGIDDYSSLLLSFIVSSSFIDRTIKLNSLKRSSEKVYEKVNEICNAYEKSRDKTSMILSRIIEVLLLYENAIFETKIILSKSIFNELNDSLSKEWIDVRNSYLIYKCQKEYD